MAVSGTPGPDAARRSHLALAGRLVVSVALLVVLISRIDFGEAFPKQHHLSTLAWFAAAVAMAALGIVLSAWRWQRVLAVLGHHVRLRTLVAHYYSGQFVGNILPSTIGGDVLRVTRLTKTIGDGPMSFASVALERLSGFLALPLLCAIGFAIDPSLLGEDRSWIALLAAGITLVALGVILFLAAHPKVAGRFRDHESWTRFIGAVHEGVTELRSRPREALGVLGTAMVYQASMVAVMFCVARTLNAPVPNGALLAYIPAVAMAQVLPISLSGLGVREGMLVLLLTPLGVKTGQAVGIGLLWYLTMLLVSLLGAPAFAVGSRARQDDGAPDDRVAAGS